jgi:hypothetical protein
VIKHHHARRHAAHAVTPVAGESAVAEHHAAAMATPSADTTGTSANYGVLGGNQVALVLALPVEVMHNAVGALGLAQV